MMFSVEHRFLFVHVPKAAGSSIRKALEPYCVPPESYWINRCLKTIGVTVNRFGPFPRQRFRIHDYLTDAERWLPSDVFSQMFKFAFVRNPWDRAVSLYSYILNRPDHHRHATVRRCANFEAFLAMEFARRTPRQVDMLCDRRGRLAVDFVGRFERFGDDVERLAERLGIALQMGHSNRSKHDSYETYYDDRTRQMVADYFAADVEQFGYQFGREVQARRVVA